ncbi:MAG: hypothetical protein LBR91_00010 [Puniceicoccales bacterium]|jgi:tRNA A37 threonylcarbamoyladenosine modification protein TsaB|nr:hypothetical protein [Puniceicoccales bacterium]
MVVGKKYLIVDAATPLVQEAIVCASGVVVAKSTRANAVDTISSLAKELFSEHGCGFDEISGMIFCNGPGSAMGLRAALISIKTWMIFHGKHFELFDYCSFDMCLALNGFADGVCTHGTNDVLILKFRGDTDVTLVAADAVKNLSGKNIVFLGTRRNSCEKYSNFVPAKYDVYDVRFDIFSICRPSDVGLVDYGGGTYRKWSPAAR